MIAPPSPRNEEHGLSLPPLEILPGPPTKPGWYWWSDDRASRGIMVGVRSIDGQLMLHRYFRDDVPASDAKGYWRSPLRTILHGHDFFKPLILP